MSARKLPPPDWDDIKRRCTILKESPKSIEKLYDVKAKTIHNRSSAEGWKVDAQEIKQRIEEKTIEKVSDIVAENLANQYIRLKQKAFEVLERHLDAKVDATPASQIASAKAILKEDSINSGRQDIPVIEPIAIDVVSEWVDEDKIQYLLTGRVPEMKEEKPNE